MTTTRTQRNHKKGDGCHRGVFEGIVKMNKDESKKQRMKKE